MGLTMALTAFIFTVIFSAIGYFEKIKPGGKLTTGTLICISFFILLMITGITDVIFKDAGSKEDKKEILYKMDSTSGEINKKIDTIMEKMKAEKAY